MKRALIIVLCAGALANVRALAQDAPDLAALQLTAQQRHTEWERLAKDMNDRMARMLPCDPRALAAVAEVSRASEARLAALSDYFKAVSAKAFGETADARNLLAAEDRRAVEAGLERADAGQEQTAVDTRADSLAQSVRQRPSLEDAKKSLEQIAAIIHQRTGTADQLASAADIGGNLLRGLVAKFEARDAALREEFSAFEQERARWSAYYAARRTRAQLECTITQITPAQPKGKQ